MKQFFFPSLTQFHGMKVEWEDDGGNTFVSK